MRLGTPVRIVAAAALLALLLVALVARENIAREQGQEVRLALAGYDPRSLLQGHYVQFNLTHDLPDGVECPQDPAGLSGREEGWVALRRQGDHHVAAGAARTWAAALKLGEIAARGRLSCLGATTDVGAPGQPPTRTVPVRLELGVDRIHLDQRQAEAVEAELRRPPPDGGPPGYAVLSIGRDGKARVKGLIVGARRIDLGWF